jgi:hypothetical protein
LPNSMGYVTSESNPIIRKKIKWATKVVSFFSSNLIIRTMLWDVISDSMDRISPACN